MNDVSVRSYLSEKALAKGMDIERIEGPSGSPEHMLRLVLEGTAKLPLDKVEAVAALIGSDARNLFRLALPQFYSQDAIALMERMLGPQSRGSGEDAWVNFVRRAAPDGVEPPGRFARRLLWTLLNRRAVD